MTVLYCTIPHFAAALAQRDNSELVGEPLALIGPEDRVFGVSAESAACGVGAGMTAKTAQIRCPEAQLLDADVARCRAELETLLQLLEGTSPEVEPHGWGAAYVELGDLVRNRADAVAFCRAVGKNVRLELGEPLQPALGWDTSKFTAQAAARRTEPGHLRAIDAVQERDFLQPLPVSLLPLERDTVRRLGFLGLRTLGQYAALPRAAVRPQFGRAGVLAYRCARGEDDRPIIPRRHASHFAAETEFETPLADRDRLMAALRLLVSPLLADLRANLQVCGQVRLSVHFDDGDAQERERAFLFPMSEEDRVMRAVSQLLDGLRWRSAATGVAVTLTQIQDAVVEQLSLFPLQDPRQEKLREVERYLASRFGASPFMTPASGSGGLLRRPMMVRPGAPLPEWRIGWRSGGEM